MVNMMIYLYQAQKKLMTISTPILILGEKESEEMIQTALITLLARNQWM